MSGFNKSEPMVIAYLYEPGKEPRPVQLTKLLSITTDSGEVTDFTTSLYDDIVSLKFLSSFANM